MFAEIICDASAKKFLLLVKKKTESKGKGYTYWQNIVSDHVIAKYFPLKAKRGWFLHDLYHYDDYCTVLILDGPNIRKIKSYES